MLVQAHGGAEALCPYVRSLNLYVNENVVSKYRGSLKSLGGCVDGAACLYSAGHFLMVVASWCGRRSVHLPCFVVVVYAKVGFKMDDVGGWWQGLMSFVVLERHIPEAFRGSVFLIEKQPNSVFFVREQKPCAADICSRQNLCIPVLA